MDRTAKIFTALALSALIGALLWRKCGCDAAGNVNTSVAANPFARGPVYLVSNLPAWRLQDDAAPFVSQTQG